MNSKQKILWIPLVLILLAASTAFAHHGWGGYKERLEMTFTVIELSLRNCSYQLINITTNKKIICAVFNLLGGAVFFVSCIKY